MRLIGMEKGGGQARIDFFGCPLRCEYCTHIQQEKREYELIEVLEFLADPEVGQVYLGGADPALQKKELVELLQRLKKMKKKVILKTSGFYPDVIKDVVELVYQFVLEVKCPLDDLECNSEMTGLSPDRTSTYVENLAHTFDILRGRKTRIWIRVIPGFLDEQKIDRIGQEIEGVATEAWLLQFLSNPQNEMSFKGINEPGPSEAEMVDLGRQLIKYVPLVIIKGEGFTSEFKAV
jgi:pyruvate formate lyase activating enzyme